MRVAASLALLLLAACSLPLRTVIPPDEQALRRAENKAGVLVDGELLRVAWLPQLSASPQALAADPAQFAGIGGGNPEPWLVSSKVVAGRAVLTFAGRPAAWRQGLIGHQDDLWPALAAARAASSFHTPIQTRLGGATVWAIGDLVPEAVLRQGGELLVTVELYEADPRQALQRPLAPISILVTGRRGPGGDEVTRSPGSFTLISRPDGFFQVGRLERGTDGRLTALEFTAWKPDPGAVVGGLVASDVLGGGHPRELVMERILTDSLVEWKTRQLPAWLGSAAPEAMEKAIIAAEKGMLQLDLKSRLVKDEIDAAARQGAGSQPALTEKAQLLDQRKTLVAVVLGAIKTARAQAR
jgi:hypothetical protein